MAKTMSAPVCINQKSLVPHSLLQVQALHDFEGQSGTGELTIRCGEVLTVLRKDVGEGWWEGTNSSGQSGLFPEAYVEVSSSCKFF